MMRKSQRRLSASVSARRRSTSDRLAMPSPCAETSLANDIYDEFRPLFAAFDKDNSGSIDSNELRSTMAAVGMDLTDDDVGVMMKAAGVNKGDQISYDGV